MSAGADYAFFPHPSITALKSAGAVFACRYISSETANDANGKNLLPAEGKALLAAGLAVVVVVEEGASMMLGAAPAGKAAALHADAVVKALGMPGTVIYYAADFDATPAQQTPINGFLDAAAVVTGRARVGVYGGFYVVKRALDAGKAAYAWQTPAWSGGQWDRRAQIRQGMTFTLGGASVDHDTAINPRDYGQWPRPAAAGAPFRHLTKAGDTVASLAGERSMGEAAWLDLQDRLGADAAALASGPLKAGITWLSVNP